MSDERGFANAASSAVLTLAAAGAECVIAGCWLGGWLSLWLALAAHAAVAGGLTLWACRAPQAHRDLRLPLLAAISTAALGPVGAIGTFLTVALARRYMRSAIPFEEWYLALVPDTQETEEQKILEQIAEAGPREAETVTAFADVLSFGSLSQKRDLIALISRHFRPAFGPLLKRALNDDHSAIRVQAATAMSKLEKSILEQTMELTLRVREALRDTEALRALAQHYDSCLFCGILDARREEGLFSEALAVYRECLAREPGDVQAQLAAGRLLLRSKRYQEAAEYFQRAAALAGDKPQAALWFMESLFQLGRFGEIRRQAQDWASRRELSGEYPPEALEAVRLWSGAAPAESL